MNYVVSLLLALATLLATRIDDFLILLVLYASLPPGSRRSRHSHAMAAGYIAGSGLTLLLSAAAAFAIQNQIPEQHLLAWLGLIPMLMGLFMLLRPRDSNEMLTRSGRILKITTGRGPFVQSLMLALILSLDDPGVYLPVMTTQDGNYGLIFILATLLGLVLTVYISQRIPYDDTLRRKLEGTKRQLLPALYLIIGTYVLLKGRIGF